MSNKILIKRGLKSSMPTLDVGELGLATDTSEIFIGTINGNKLVNSSGGGGGLTPEQEAKLDLIKSSGDGTKYLADDGVYKVVSGGGEGIDLNEMAYFNYAGSIYGAKYNLLANAWQDMKDSETVLFDIPLALAAPNQEMGGMVVDLYTGDSDLTQLYNDCVNEVIPLPSSGNLGDIYLINNVAVKYYGEISGDIGFPIPLFEFGDMNDVNGFIIGDLTPLGIGLGITLAKITSVPIPNNKLTIQQGFEFENESGIIIPDSVISIGDRAFYNWRANNHPLVIPNSVTSIGDLAFYNWTANNHPLVIPNSVTSIGDRAFYNWTNVPYIEMKSETPPTLANSHAFGGQNDAPIYVPHDSVDDYKTATNWTVYADRIFSINDK